MQIPQNLYQFKKTPVLLVVSGEFEVKFYVISNNNISEENFFELNPREEAREKQAFVGKKGGMQSLSAISHHDRYIEDLKEKFLKKLREAIDEICTKKNIENIYFFLPNYTENKIIESLSKDSIDKLLDVFQGNFVKENPLKLIEIIKNKKNESIKNLSFSKEEKYIKNKPHTKPGK